MSIFLISVSLQFRENVRVVNRVEAITKLALLFKVFCQVFGHRNSSGFMNDDGHSHKHGIGEKIGMNIIFMCRSFFLKNGAVFQFSFLSNWIQLGDLCKTFGRYNGVRFGSIPDTRKFTNTCLMCCLRS